MNNKIYYALIAIGFLILSHSAFSNNNSCPEYNRSDWGYRSALSPYKHDKIGFYTNRRNPATDVDHIVSLHDAHMSGGCAWTAEKMREFANDPENQVAAAPAVNRIVKKHYAPKRFFKRMEQSHKEFYDEMRKCMYVTRYRNIKAKYNLHMTKEDYQFVTDFLASCPKRMYASNRS